MCPEAFKAPLGGAHNCMALLGGECQIFFTLDVFVVVRLVAAVAHPRGDLSLVVGVGVGVVWLVLLLLG